MNDGVIWKLHPVDIGQVQRVLFDLENEQNSVNQIVTPWYSPDSLSRARKRKSRNMHFVHNACR